MVTESGDRKAVEALERHRLTLAVAAELTDAELLALRGIGPKMLARIREITAELDESVVAGVKRDLADIARRDPALARSSLALSALALARELDADNSATSKSMCARALRETIDRLRELVPPDIEGDMVDDLAGRARLKLVGGASA